LKVLSVVTSFDPERGGTQAAAANMIRATQRAGVDNTAVAAGAPEARRRARVLTDQLEADSVHVRQFATVSWPPEARDRWGLSHHEVRWILREASGFDLIHVHGAWGLTLLSALAAGRLRGVPVVVTPHESFTDFDIGATAKSSRRHQKLLLKRLYLRWAALFVVTSELEASDSFADPAGDKVRVVHHPLVERADELPPLRSRATDGELRVGFLGRIHPKKNLDVLIEALASLPDHVRLLVAGDGPVAGPMRQLAHARGIEARTDWLGFVPPDQAPRFLAGIDVLAMPSAFESFGMSAAEAMLHGVPVIVSPKTGIAEVIRRHGGGVIVDADAASTAAAISGLDRDRDSLEALATDGQAAVCTELTYARIGEALTRAYRDVLETG
jgi:glycosyltransferase involved in cell wall biosynthesis